MFINLLVSFIIIMCFAAVITYGIFYYHTNYIEITNKFLKWEWIIVYINNIKGSQYRVFCDLHHIFYYAETNGDLHKLHQGGTCDPSTKNGICIYTWTPLTPKVAKYYKKEKNVF